MTTTVECTSRHTEQGCSYSSGPVIIKPGMGEVNSLCHARAGLKSGSVKTVKPDLRLCVLLAH